MSSPAYKIENSAVTEYSIPYEGLPIRIGKTADLHCLLPGLEGEHWYALLPMVQEIATRVTPHVTWWCAPAVPCTPYDGAAGWSHDYSSTIALRTDMDCRWTIHTAFHEAYHSVEPYLTAAEYSAVWNAVNDRGPIWPDEYIKQPQEMLANAFAAFAMSHFSGCGIITGKEFPETQVFADILSGAIGKRILKRGGLPRRLLQMVGVGRLRAA